MYFSRFIIIITLTACMSSCAKIEPPAIKQLDNIATPKYTGHITPISIPIQPMYKPVEVKTKSSQIHYMISKENNSATSQKTSESIQVWLDTKITNMGDLLVWDVNIRKMKVNGELIDHGMNIVEIRLLSDRYGEIKESEATAPALVSANVSHQLIDDFIASMKNMITKANSVLSKEPVKSGDFYAHIDEASLTDFIGSMFQEAGMDLVESIDGGIKTTVKGWGFYDGEKVIVLSIDEVISMKHNIAYAGDVLSNFTINGYSLVDPESFQVIEDKSLIVFDMNFMLFDDTWIKGKAYTEMSSKVTQ